MSTADFATLVTIANEANRDEPSRQLLDELAGSVSDDAKELAKAISVKSKANLDADKQEYYDVIVKLAAEE